MLNVDPAIGGEPGATGQVGEDHEFEPTGDDPGDDTFTWSGTLPEDASIDADSGEAKRTPAEAGEIELSIRVIDDDGGSDTLTWSVVVDAAPGDDGTGDEPDDTGEDTGEVRDDTGDNVDVDTGALDGDKDPTGCACSSAGGRVGDLLLAGLLGLAARLRRSLDTARC